jgi:catechol 2,3-dioxygenase-like lactoylglutathione lyase family enzyme
MPRRATRAAVNRNRGEATMPLNNIIDHVQVAVSDYGKAREFYVKALAPLGWTMMMEFPMGGDRMAGGLGTQGKPYLWLSNTGKPVPTGHVALGAKNAGEVDAFYQAAMGAGGTDNGPPGIRKEYHDKYYAAFVRDPDGNNIEAVWHGQVEEETPAAAPKRARAAARRAPAKRPAAKAGAKKPAAKKATAKKPAGRKAPAKKPAGRGRAGGARGRTTRR